MQKQSHSFVKKAAILAAAGLIVRFIGFLYRVPLQNLLDEQGGSYYSAAYSIYNFLFVLSSAGLPAAISKMVAERSSLGEFKNAKKVFYVALVFAFLTGTIGGAILFFKAEAIAAFIEIPGSALAIKSLAPTLLLVAFLGVIRGYFQGLNHMMPTAISQIVEQIFNAIFSIALAALFYKRLKLGLEMGACGAAMGTGIGAFFGLITMLFLFMIYRPIEQKSIKNDNSSKLMPSSILLKRLLYITLPIVLGSAIYSLTDLIDTGMLMNRLATIGFSQTQSEALYGRLKNKYSTIITLPVALSSALAAAAIPSISASYVRGDDQKVKEKINTAIKISMLIAFPSAIGLSILAKPIMLMLFHSENGADLLQVGSYSVIFLSLTQILTGILQGISYVYVPFFSALFASAIKIVVNYNLIAMPALNIYGAIIGTLICYIVSSCINMFFVLKYTKVSLSFHHIFIKPLFASIIMGIICKITYFLLFTLTKNIILSTMLSICLSMISYLFVLLQCRGISEKDIRMLPMGDKLVVLLQKYKFIRW